MFQNIRYHWSLSLFQLYFETNVQGTNKSRRMKNNPLKRINGVFPKSSKTFNEFSEFSEFRESEKSLKHEVDQFKYILFTCAFLAMGQSDGFSHKR